MRTFYFVGGPVEGQAEAFFGRLAQVGGAPPRLADLPARER